MIESMCCVLIFVAINYVVDCVKENRKDKRTNETANFRRLYDRTGYACPLLSGRK